MILVSLCNRFLVSLTQDLEREMQLDLARQLEEINKEMDEQLLADLQVWWLFLYTKLNYARILIGSYSTF